MTDYSSRDHLINELINHWRFWDRHEEYYLKTLAPQLVANPGDGDEEERRILESLQQSISSEEWIDLPSLISARRAENRLQDEREREKREERARLDQERLRTEQLEREQESRKKEAEIRRLRKVEAEREALLNELRRKLSENFLGAEAFFDKACVGLISTEEFEREKVAFVKTWLARNTPKSESGKRDKPDQEQFSAVAAVRGHVQVIARAGSGKTRTLVLRTLFLIRHCAVPATQILLLAFNRKAAQEIRKKLLVLLSPDADAAIKSELERKLRGKKKAAWSDKEDAEAEAVEIVASKLSITLPHIMTFHALAYAIVHPEETILHDDEEGDSLTLSRVFQQVIDDHLQIPVFREQIRNVMLAHFRADWDRIVHRGYDRNKSDLVQFRRSLPRESLGGEYVKSDGEKLIADFLFEHNVIYKYERNFWWDGINYRPDFTIFLSPNSGVVIEYFGLEGDLDYDEMSEEKRKYWRGQRGWALVEFSPSDINFKRPQSFLDLLKSHLEELGIPCAKLSEDEIWRRIRDRAVDRFTKSAVNFMGRCRKSSLSDDELHARIDAHTAISNIESRYLKLIRHLYSAYLQRLAATGEDDFDGLLQRAAGAIQNGQTVFRRKSSTGDLEGLRYICIDEFQDFSDLFYQLLESIRSHNSNVELFCVGDDWQAINGFAGSDLKYFREFEKYIGNARKLYISTNYRSSSAIVSLGNLLMDGKGGPAKPDKKESGRVLVADLNHFEPSTVEKERHSGDVITPAVLRLAGHVISHDQKLVVLSRRKYLPWFVNYQNRPLRDGLDGYLDLVRSHFPKEMQSRVSNSTAHKYKGLEQPWVIVADAVARSYPLIHPDWIFTRIFGDNPQKIIEEERRLLYVALTRAEETLVIFTDGQSKSPLLEEIERKEPIEALDWQEFPPPRSLESRLVVKVGNQEGKGISPTFAIRDVLRANGYQWQSTDWKGWAKSHAAEAFTIGVVQEENWSSSGDGIEIRVFDEGENWIAQYFVDNGKWECQFDQLENVSNRLGRI